jgi:hypothetical protein
LAILGNGISGVGQQPYPSFNGSTLEMHSSQGFWLRAARLSDRSFEQDQDLLINRTAFALGQSFDLLVHRFRNVTQANGWHYGEF